VVTIMHKRSGDKRQGRRIRRIILVNSFRDRTQCEMVCRMSRADVLGLLNEDVQVGLVPDVERGEILTDSRGRGTFQRMTNAKEEV